MGGEPEEVPEVAYVYGTGSSWLDEREVVVSVTELEINGQRVDGAVLAMHDRAPRYMKINFAASMATREAIAEATCPAGASESLVTVKLTDAGGPKEFVVAYNYAYGDEDEVIYWGPLKVDPGAMLQPGVLP